MTISKTKPKAKYLFVLQHLKSGLLWLGESADDPQTATVCVDHWKWQELLACSPKVKLLSTRKFKDVASLRDARRRFVKQHKVDSLCQWVNSGLYQDRQSSYVYLIRHVASGMFYVGSRYAQHANPSRFFVDYFTSSQRVQDLGTDSFEVVQVKACKNARDVERAYLKHWYAELGPQGFQEIFINRNTAPGIILDELAIERMRRSKALNSRKGIPHSDEHRANISKALRGHKFSEETLAKMSAAAKRRKRRPHSPETIQKMRQAAARREPHSEETRRKISLARYGTKASAETRAKMSQTHSRRYAENPSLRAQVSDGLRRAYAEGRRAHGNS